MKHWDEWQLILLTALSNQMSHPEVMPAKSNSAWIYQTLF